VEHPPFFLQVAKQLRNEKRIATGLIMKLAYESRGRIVVRECCEHATHVGFGERAKRDRTLLSLTDKLSDRRLDALRGEPLSSLTTQPVEEMLKRALGGSGRCDLDVAERRNDQNRQHCKMLRKMLGQLQR